MLSPLESLLGPLLDMTSDLVVLVDPDARIVMFNRACERLTGYRRDEVLHTEIGQRLVPACCGKAARHDPSEANENLWLTKAGERRLIRWRPTVLRDEAGRPHYVLCIGTDVTEQQRLDQQLRAQSRLMNSFFESTLTCAVLLDRDFNFLRVNDAYARACGRDIGEFIGRNHFELYPSDARQIFEEVVRTKQPYQVQARPFSFPDHPEWGVTYWDWTLVPVLDERDEVEVLVFCLNDVTESRRQLDSLRILSHQIAEAQERERWRIGLDLHDEVGQGLTAVKLALRNAMHMEPPLRDGRLTGALEAVDGLIEAVRRIALDLRPPMLDDLGLLPALLWLIDRHQSQSGLRVDFKHSGLDRRLPSAVETAAYRIIQEALTNVVRYSCVSDAVVLVRVTNDTAYLKVEDHGMGFDVQGAAPDAGGTGLPGMRERARLLGGRLTIESTPGTGTAITAELPLVAAQD